MSDIDVFISYKREERSLADQVARALKEAGYVAVTDLNIQKATDFGEAIDRMIREARVVVVLWTRASAASEWVRKEANEAERLGKYLGVRIDAVTPGDLPLQVRNNNWLDLSDASLPQSLPALLAEVQRLAGQTTKDAATAETAAQTAEKDLEFYQVVSEIGDVGGFRKYLQLYPKGAYVEDAKAHIRRRSGWRAIVRAIPIFSIITAIGTGVGAFVALSGAFGDGNTSDLTAERDAALERLRSAEEQIATLKTTLSDLRAQTSNQTVATLTFDGDSTILAARFEPLNNALREKFKIDASMRRGVVVTGLSNDSAFYKAGLRSGDLIATINGETVYSAQQIHNVLRVGLRDGTDVFKISGLRGSRGVYIHLVLTGYK
jgi:membrane-associated protease RseP (regulator of RpoE activity)